MNAEDLNRFKKRLLEEQHLLETELSAIGSRDPEQPNAWRATAGDIETDTADPNDLADTFEELEGNAAVLEELEARRGDVKKALARIEEGTYGMCEVGNEPIERERLDANPTARTCREHLQSA
jgi:RNA polymerase-binding transcription factor DksA